MIHGGRKDEPTEEGSYTTHGTKGTEERKGGESFLLFFFFFFLTLSSGKWTGDVLVGVRGAEEEEGRAELVTADTEGAKVGGKGAKNVGRNTVSFTSIFLPPSPFSQKNVGK